MKQAQPRELVRASVDRNEDLGGGCRLLGLRLAPPASALAVEPGQFFMVRGPWGKHPMLPRAFSALWAEGDGLELLVKVVGHGTRLLGALERGASVSLLGPLGCPFPPSSTEALDLLIGGGSGIPPLCMQARRASKAGLGSQVEIVYGGRSGADLPLLARLEELGVAVFPCTEDGSLGSKGLVTDVLLERLAARGGAARVMACGPLGMLRAIGALSRERDIPCFLSLETGMACGVGLCRGCVVPRADGRGYLCTCTEGPVVDAREVRL
ncbi:MAG: dihydroorotate dehydrogenase electron transfer subunit [Polyangia bacterium]|nr:dihydroorotate dehydrogenase electron transfer subunit [Polyangia bacterium]